ncbi:MAG: CRISPR-associated endonuclease Cas1, partial [Clostridia bacterium]|nr:CRISPR-associated endonuclease Cas1 [Clostridia bacterium]
SLALDLMEEFRPCMDRIFLKLSNKRMLLLGDFRFFQEDEEDSAGVYLTYEGMKKVIAEFQGQIRTRSLDSAINAQVHALSKAIKGESTYSSYILRP